eukprot:g12948.t1
MSLLARLLAEARARAEAQQQQRKNARIPGIGYSLGSSSFESFEESPVPEPSMGVPVAVPPPAMEAGNTSRLGGGKAKGKITTSDDAVAETTSASDGASFLAFVRNLSPEDRKLLEGQSEVRLTPTFVKEFFFHKNYDAIYEGPPMSAAFGGFGPWTADFGIDAEEDEQHRVVYGGARDGEGATPEGRKAVRWAAALLDDKALRKRMKNDLSEYVQEKDAHPQESKGNKLHHQSSRDRLKFLKKAAADEAAARAVGEMCEKSWRLFGGVKTDKVALADSVFKESVKRQLREIQERLKRVAKVQRSLHLDGKKKEKDYKRKERALTKMQKQLKRCAEVLQVLEGDGGGLAEAFKAKLQEFHRSGQKNEDTKGKALRAVLKELLIEHLGNNNMSSTELPNKGDILAPRGPEQEACLEAIARGLEHDCRAGVSGHTLSSIVGGLQSSHSSSSTGKNNEITAENVLERLVPEATIETNTLIQGFKRAEKLARIKRKAAEGINLMSPADAVVPPGGGHEQGENYKPDGLVGLGKIRNTARARSKKQEIGRSDKSKKPRKEVDRDRPDNGLLRKVDRSRPLSAGSSPLRSNSKGSEASSRVRSGGESAAGSAPRNKKVKGRAGAGAPNASAGSPRENRAGSDVGKMSAVKAETDAARQKKKKAVAATTTPAEDTTLVRPPASEEWDYPEETTSSGGGGGGEEESEKIKPGLCDRLEAVLGFAEGGKVAAAFGRATLNEFRTAAQNPSEGGAFASLREKLGEKYNEGGGGGAAQKGEEEEKDEDVPTTYWDIATRAAPFATTDGSHTDGYAGEFCSVGRRSVGATTETFFNGATPGNWLKFAAALGFGRGVVQVLHKVGPFLEDWLSDRELQHASHAASCYGHVNIHAFLQNALQLRKEIKEALSEGAAQYGGHLSEHAVKEDLDLQAPLSAAYEDGNNLNKFLIGYHAQLRDRRWFRRQFSLMKSRMLQAEQNLPAEERAKRSDIQQLERKKWRLAQLLCTTSDRVRHSYSAASQAKQAKRFFSGAMLKGKGLKGGERMITHAPTHRPMDLFLDRILRSRLDYYKQLERCKAVAAMVAATAPEPDPSQSQTNDQEESETGSNSNHPANQMLRLQAALSLTAPANRRVFYAEEMRQDWNVVHVALGCDRDVRQRKDGKTKKEVRQQMLQALLMKMVVDFYRG